MNVIRLDDINVPKLQIFTGENENRLFHYYEPEPGLFIAESPNVIERAVNAGYEPICYLMEERYLDVVGAASDVEVYIADSEILKKLTGYPMTKGMLCAMRRRTLPMVDEICRNASRIVVLEEVQNPTNVGAIFRSAAALGIDAVLLTEGCSDPLYRRAARVSMGTVFQIPWTFIDKKTCAWPTEGMELLKNMGFKIASMALEQDSVSLDDKNLISEDKLAIIMGTEGNGLMKETIANSDYTVMIPMAHGVDSLNVAAASAVAFWQLGKR